MLSPHASSGLLAVLSFAAAAPTQWPGSPATNLAIGDGAGDQVVEKIAPTSDGGCYVAWFDNRNGSYAVYAQRLDAGGNEQWPHGGVLVSGNPQASSLVDWEILCDSADHCVLVFTDTRSGPDLDVYAYRLAPNGTLVWGSNGVTLSSNADSEGNPRVCEANDGDFVVVWPNTTLHTIQMQRISPAGTPRFPGDGIGIPGETGATPAFARVVAGAPGTGDVIVSWVRTLAFTGNKHVHAQKFDALGNASWNGGTRIAVFDQASVPIAHEPRLVPDGTGGAVIAWHFAVGQLFSARVQHVDGNGTELFAHDGANVSASANSKFDPAVVWSGAAQRVLVAWNERNVAQSSWGIFAQQLDAAGAPQWGGTGIALLPIDTVEKFAPVAAPLRRDSGNDGIAIGVLASNGTGQQKHLHVFGLDGTGAPAFAAVVASTAASDKLRLQPAVTPSGTQLFIWTDLRNGTSDVYAAAVDARGAVGVSLATATIGGCGVNPAGSLAVQGRPAIGTTMQWELTNPLGTQAPGSLGFFFVGLGAVGFPCGIAVPGFGMAGPGAPGEVTLDLNQGFAGFFAGAWAPAAPVTLPFPVPFSPGLIGAVLYLQGLMLDVAPGALVPFGLSNGARIVVGS